MTTPSFASNPALFLDTCIFGLLGLMSVIMLALTIERVFFFWRINLKNYGHIESLNVSLTKHLTSIASIASNAPYIGLLGTVIGILITFNEMGTSGKIDVNNIMVGLAMALKATAAGLVVAIPAMMFYNALSRRADTLVSEWKVLHEKV